ncbi:MAG: terminase family protein [Pseudomonadota bacterium]
MTLLADKSDEDLLAEILDLPLDKQREALRLLEAIKLRERQSRFFHTFPDETGQYDGEVQYARRLYAKHLELIRAGATYRERAFRAANRCGKTVTGSYEVTAHATGLYPDWWDGRRFRRRTKLWAAGKTNETTRDIVQQQLCGNVITVGGKKRTDGTGMIPGWLLHNWSWRQGVADTLDSVSVRHVGGRPSKLGFKSYQQGRDAFEGTSRDVIWLDEEPPADIYGECLMRTATTNGLMLLTFTPLLGISEVVKDFMPKEED